MAEAAQRNGDQFARIAPYYDQLMASVPYARWADYISDLAVLAQRPLSPGAHLLDVATGTGSAALEFARRGLRITGLDLSAPMIEVAKRKAAEAGLQATFLVRDMSRFSLPAEFDGAVCLYDSLNYLLDPELLKRAFANVRAALRPTGVFIFDVNTVHALEAELFTQTSPSDAPVRYRWRSRYDRESHISTIQMRFAIEAAQQEFTIVQRQRGYTDTELRAFLHHAGFAEPRTFGAYRFTPPQVTSDRVFYVATVA